MTALAIMAIAFNIWAASRPSSLQSPLAEFVCGIGVGLWGAVLLALLAKSRSR